MFKKAPPTVRVTVRMRSIQKDSSQSPRLATPSPDSSPKPLLHPTHRTTECRRHHFAFPECETPGRPGGGGTGQTGLIACNVRCAKELGAWAHLQKRLSLGKLHAITGLGFAFDPAASGAATMVFSTNPT